MPTKVLVSPLRRACKTAGLLFPDPTLPKIAKECLREKRTGKRADERVSAPEILREFASSSSSSGGDSDSKDSGASGEAAAVVPLSPLPPPPAATTMTRTAASVTAGWSSSSSFFVDGNGGFSGKGAAPSSSGCWDFSEILALDAASPDGFTFRKELEEKNPQVRARAAGLPDLLFAQEGDDAIAVVTHKGFLREFLEGTLKELLPEGQQRELSSTFGNVEVRVLELHWRADGTLCRAFARGLERARLRSTIKIKERCGSGSEHSEHGSPPSARLQRKSPPLPPPPPPHLHLRLNDEPRGGVSSNNSPTTEDALLSSRGMTAGPAPAAARGAFGGSEYSGGTMRFGYGTSMLPEGDASAAAEEAWHEMLDALGGAVPELAIVYCEFLVVVGSSRRRRKKISRRSSSSSLSSSSSVVIVVLIQINK